MSFDMTKAQKYLLPPTRAFWKWSEDGEVICWRDDRTILFKAELIQILEQLAPMGLPSLSSLVVTLAAMREGWDSSVAEVRASIEVYQPSSESNQLVEDVLVGSGGLAKLAALSQRLRASTDARIGVCQMIFENAQPVILPEDAGTIIQYLNYGMDDILASYNSPGFQVLAFRAISLADLKQLSRGLEVVNEKTLDLRQRTSLDELPQVADVGLPQSQQMRGLLEQLRQDDMLHGIAKLAKQLMGAVSLPRKVSDPDEVPTGGISDISNRGSLDRLMLTELAHDDLTLAVRVSSNEALYLRRESPPQATWREFSLFLDCGIRMWGVPRFYATAVALALVANGDEHTIVKAYRADGTRLKDVDLLTREGIVEHLECLLAESHPGPAMEALAAKLCPDEESNPVIITTDDVAGDKSFQQALASQEFRLLYLTTVNRDGTLTMEQRGVRGKKLLRELELNLEELYDSQPKKLPALVEKVWANDLPAIFSASPFPLLLAVNITSDQQMHLADRGVLGITKDRRLVHWHDRSHVGARQLVDDLPPGRLQWYQFDRTNDIVHAVIADTNSRQQHLVEVHLRKHITRVMEVQTASEIVPLALRGGMLLGQKGGSMLCAVDPASGEEVQSSGLPTSWGHCSGRFFRNPRSDEWSAATFDGKMIRLESVFSKPPDKTPWLMHMFECEEVEGPIGITHQGDICFTNDGELWETQIPRQGAYRVRVTGQHASRICLSSSGLGNYVIDVEKRTVNSANRRNTSTLIYGESAEFITPSNTRHRFTHIQICENESGYFRLGLTTRRGQRMMIDCTHGITHLRFSRDSKTKDGQLRQPFSPLDIPEIGYQVSRAVWSDGSEAFLDSRGLLHLRSSEQFIPEVTIALTDGVVGGWVSDGRLWGVHYFTQQQPDRDNDADVFEKVLCQFVEQLT